MKKLGKILWWSHRDLNGVITDSQGNEYYFDKSVVGFKKSNNLERGTLVHFEPCRCDNVLVARSISLPSSRLIARYEEQFNYEQKQLRLPVAV